MSEKRSILDSMKAQIKNSGKSYGSFFNIKESGSKVRVRFLTEMDEAIEMEFHSKWNGGAAGIYHPCLSYYGADCPNCDVSDVKTAPEFILQCWNYETKRVEIFKFKANKCTPIFDLVNIYEEYGTITDMDIVITRNGVQTDTSYSVMPKAPAPFKYKQEAMKKVRSKEKLYAEILTSNDRFGEDPEDLLDVHAILEDAGMLESDEKPRKRTKAKPATKSSPATKKRRKREPEPEYDDEYEDDYDEDEDMEDEDDIEEEYEPPVRKSRKKAPAKKAPARRKKRPEPEPEDEYDLDEFDEDYDDDDVPF